MNKHFVLGSFLLLPRGGEGGSGEGGGGKGVGGEGGGSEGGDRLLPACTVARGKQQPPAKGANLASPRPTLYDNFTWEEIPGKKDTATQRQPNWQRRVERESPPCSLQPLRRMNCGSAGPTMNCLSRGTDCG